MSWYSKSLFFSLLWLSSVSYGQVISEFLASNASTPPSTGGLYEDWIEIHNDSAQLINFSGWFLTDDPTNLKKWTFPSTNLVKVAPGGYLLIFADNSTLPLVNGTLHASFKLSAGGEYLALVEPDGETVAHQYAPKFPDQTTDVSYGLDGVSSEPTFFATPTPGAPNGQGIADMVQFSAVSGTFTNAFELTLTAYSPTAAIHFTTDGSLPDTNSTVYSLPIPISETTRIRTQVYDPGRTPGPVRSETFIHLTADAAAFTSDLPVIIVENFGAGDLPDSSSPTRQLSQIMIMEPVEGVCRLSTAPEVSSRAGINRRGETSMRPTDKKPNLAIETWGEIDEDSQSIKPLGMPEESDWILHAPWHIDSAMMRNSFIYDVSRDAGRYAVRERFVEVFFNYDGGSISATDYNGLYVLMEKIKIGPDRVDIQKLSPSATNAPDITGGYLWKLDKAEAAGTNDINNFTAAGKALPVNVGDSAFQYVSPSGDELTPVQKAYLTNYLNATSVGVSNKNYKGSLDVAAYADHHILNVFAQNADGLRLSTFFHKDRKGLLIAGPIWDFDRSMGCDNDTRPSNPQVWSLASNPVYFFHSTAPLWYRALALDMADADFWTTWVDRWQAMRDGPLSNSNMIQRIEGYRTEIAAAAERNYVRWDGVYHNDQVCIPPSLWSNKVDVLKNHVLVRAQWIDDKLIDPPVYSPAAGLVTSGAVVTITCGTNKIHYTRNGADPRASGGTATGILYSLTNPITITSNTIIKTRGWNNGTFTSAPNQWPWSPLREAVYVVNPATLAITEIMYHPRSPTNTAELTNSTSDFEFIEIQNTNNVACSLIGVQLLSGVKFDFTYGSNTTLGAGAYGVVVANLAAFKLRYTNWPSLNILGTFTGKLSDSGDQLKLGYVNTNIPGQISFDYEDDWYPSTDGEGFSLVLNQPQSDPLTWDSKTAWRYSSKVDGSPGVSNPALTYASGSIVINEVLSHQDIDNPGDWIELRNTTSSNIAIGGWFLSDSLGDLTKYTIPAGTVVPANGYLVLTEHSHFGSAFALSEFGDSVYLSAGSGGSLANPAYRESVSFDAQERTVTVGRYTKSDGKVVFVPMASATTNIMNSAPKVGPIVIDEILYNPITNQCEYLRLKNISGSTVQLYDPLHPSNTWRVSGIDFDFPSGVQLSAGESVLLVRDTLTVAEFRLAYSIPPSLQVFNYSGSMDNNSETIEIKKPGDPELNTGYVPYIAVEKVEYKDSTPWPLEADGMGMALGRINTATYADDVINWQAVTSPYIYTPPQYSLTVHSGSGTGSYTAGTIVPIQANDSLNFSEWIGDTNGIADVKAASTTLTMPAANIQITATYFTNHLLTVNSGSGSGHYFPGTLVPIQADTPTNPRLIFAKWTGDTNGIANITATNTTLAMPTADTQITATYATKYQLTVTSGSGNGLYLPGALVSIQADTPTNAGLTFSKWGGDTNSIANVNSATTTLTMPAADIQITAIYATNVLLTVNSGSGDGRYAPGSIVPISADSVSGKTFVYWAGNTNGMTNTTTANSALILPSTDITITAVYATTNITFFSSNSVWRYHDKGQNLSNVWRELSYNDSTWSNGLAKLGYNDNAVTVVSYGPDSNNRYITTYFRKTFTVANTAAVTALSLQLLRDDGAIVYINGTEAVRDNMPTGAVNYLTLASSAVANASESTFYPFSISPSLLVNGTNVIAIELHQQAASSSDLGMNASLQGNSYLLEEVPDGDADGIPDAWELQHFGSTQSNGPVSDSDGDGQSDNQEYIAGTQPTNSASKFVINQISGSTLSWTAITGRLYSIYWSSNLISHPLEGIATGLTQSNYTDSAHTNKTGYYHLKVELQ
ncbi:MAG: hypothetical protein FJ220_00195 [Kiritimatiellaceae bacterium]|nr:hypothetical protein [Kiritimatiellaceae bacterium]